MEDFQQNSERRTTPNYDSCKGMSIGIYSTCSVNLPIEHSTIPQIASHVGSRGRPLLMGLDVLTPTWMTRRQANMTQMKPVANRHMMEIFLPRGI